MIAILPPLWAAVAATGLGGACCVLARRPSTSIRVAATLAAVAVLPGSALMVPRLIDAAVGRMVLGSPDGYAAVAAFADHAL